MQIVLLSGEIGSGKSTLCSYGSDMQWYKFGLDVPKTIKQLVQGGALAYEIETQYDDQGKELESEINEAWVRLENPKKARLE